MHAIHGRALSPSFGQEITGLDLSRPLAAPLRHALEQALMQHQLLLFRGQQLNEAQQVAFSQLFGACRPLAQSRHYPSSNPLAQYLSNVDRNGEPVGVHPDADSVYWHSDGSWAKSPAKATVLHAMQVPVGGGPTHFANMYRVYEELDQAQQRRLGGLRAEHHVALSRASRGGRMPRQWWSRAASARSLRAQLRWWRDVRATRRRDRPTVHPLVRQHPATGRKSLFAGDHAWRVVGRPWPSGIRLMEEIKRLPFGADACYTHHWAPDDLLIWENHSLLHRVGAYDLQKATRVIRRCVVLG